MEDNEKELSRVFGSRAEWSGVQRRIMKQSLGKGLETERGKNKWRGAKCLEAEQSEAEDNETERRVMKRIGAKCLEAKRGIIKWSGAECLEVARSKE